jgi:hypothetical protein
MPHGVLVLKVAVHRDEGIEPPAGPEQQFPVAHTRPTEALDRCGFVSG